MTPVKLRISPSLGKHHEMIDHGKLYLNPCPDYPPYQPEQPKLRFHYLNHLLIFTISLSCILHVEVVNIKMIMFGQPFGQIGLTNHHHTDSLKH